MFEKVLISCGELELRLSDYPGEDIIYLLNNTIQGSQGGMRYSLRDVESRIAEYGDKIRFISLYKKGQLAGTIGTCFRVTGQGPLKANCTYIRYFAFQSFYQSDPEIYKHEKQHIRIEKEDSFKQKILELFSKPHILDFQNVSEGNKHIMFAYVESMNERSKNIVHQAGYEYLRSFLTVAFSRFSPSFYSKVELLKEEEKPLMTQLLNSYYSGYSLFTADYAFIGNKYYVLKEGNEIIAGVCAIPSGYWVYNIPGVWGWIIMNVLPYIPYYRRLFQPGEFRFIVFDAIYCRKGKEKRLATLFESVCAREGFNTALMWLDDRSELFEKLQYETDMGVFNRMLNAKPGLVYFRFINFDEKEKERFYDSPAYICGIDLS